MKTRLVWPLLPGLLLACNREPKLPAERAAAVQEAREDVGRAEEKLAAAHHPTEVVAASKDLAAASVDFQKTRDEALQSVRDTLDGVDADIRTLVDTRSQTQFQLASEAKKADDAIKDLVNARTALEATLSQMRIATVDSWPPLKTRVDTLTAALRDARTRGFDALF